MSSSPIAPTSKTRSSTSSGSEQAAIAPDRLWGDRPAVPPRSVERHAWPVDVHPLPPCCTTSRKRSPARCGALAERLRQPTPSGGRGLRRCGTYGALDEVCADLGLERLPGLHCYDVFAGPSRIETFFEEQPGTYLLTDFLVRSFTRTVEKELGLDRWPMLRDDYFGSLHPRRVAGAGARHRAHALASGGRRRLGLPLTVVESGLRPVSSAPSRTSSPERR